MPTLAAISWSFCDKDEQTAEKCHHNHANTVVLEPESQSLFSILFSSSAEKKKYVVPCKAGNGINKVHFWFEGVATPAEIVLHDCTPIVITCNNSGDGVVKFTCANKKSIETNLFMLHIWAMKGSSQVWQVCTGQRVTTDSVRELHGAKFTGSLMRNTSSSEFPFKLEVKAWGLVYGDVYVNVKVEDDMELVQERCLCPKDNVFEFVARHKHDWTMELKTTMYLPHVGALGKDAKKWGTACIEPFKNYVTDVKLRYKLFGECTPFASRNELCKALSSIMDEESLRDVCEIYGPFSTWNVSNVRDLSHLFYAGWHEYESGFGKDHYRRVSQMYSHTLKPLREKWEKRRTDRIELLSSLASDEKTLDLSHWTISDDLTSVRAMFARCSSLRRIVLPLTLTFSCTSGSGSIIDVSQLFVGCTSLVESSINISTNYATNDVKINCSDMFANCCSLRSSIVDLPRTLAGQVNFDRTFLNCSTLNCVELMCEEDEAKEILVFSARDMFLNCFSLASLTTSLKLVDVFKADGMFSNCTSLTFPYVSRFLSTNLRLQPSHYRYNGAQYALPSQFADSNFKHGMFNIAPLLSKRHYVNGEDEECVTVVGIDLAEPKPVNKSDILRIVRALLSREMDCVWKFALKNESEHELFIVDNSNEDMTVHVVAPNGGLLEL